MVLDAESHVRDRRFDDADQLIRRIQIQAPDQADLNLRIAAMVRSMGRVDDSVQICEQVARRHPDRATYASACAADFLFQSGRTFESIERFEQTLKRDPGSSAIRRRLIEILEQQGLCFDASEHLRYLMKGSALTLDELSSLAFPLRVILGESRGADTESGQGDAENSLPEMALATKALLAGELSSARSALRGGEWLTQRHPAAVSLYAHTLAQAQQFEELRQCLLDAPVACRRYPDYWIAAGTLAIHDKEPSAPRCFAEAITREPNSIPAHYGMVLALESQDDRRRAEVFRVRARLVIQVQTLVHQIREQPMMGASPYFEIGALLNKAGRSTESLSWQELAITLFEPASQRLGIVRQYKQRLAVTQPRGWTLEKLLCGWEFPDQNLHLVWLDSLMASAEENPERIPRTDFSEQSKRLRGASFNHPTPRFTNVAVKRKLDFQYRNASEPKFPVFRIFEGLGSGIACLDMDCDGWTDLFCGQAGSDLPGGRSKYSDQLYRNLPERFHVITEQAGVLDDQYTLGVSAGDLNQDGFADLVVGNLKVNQILFNQGDGTFVVAPQDDAWRTPTFTTGIAIADVTGDALPDVIEVNYLDDPEIFTPLNSTPAGRKPSESGPLWFKAANDRLFVTQPDGGLESQWIGGDRLSYRSTGLGVLVTDFDEDQRNEVFVANDMNANHYWTHPADVSSRESASILGLAYGRSGKPYASMGITAADFDFDGQVDLHVTNYQDEWSNLYLQQPDHSFVDTAPSSGIDLPTWSMVGFGTQAIDYDNDSHWDIVIGNGHVEPVTRPGSQFRMPTQLLVGDGARFHQVDVVGDDAFWTNKRLSRGMAKFDGNRDGKMDFVLSDLADPIALMQNETETQNHFLQLSLSGVASERDSVGAHVTVRLDGPDDGLWLKQSVQAGDGYCAKNESVLAFGVGTHTTVDRIEVRWPSGTQQTFRDVPVDHRYLIIEGQPETWLLW